MHEEIYSLGQVAKEIGIAPFRITYAISTGLVPDAKMRFAGRRVFTHRDVQRLAEHFDVDNQGDEETSPTEVQP